MFALERKRRRRQEEVLALLDTRLACLLVDRPETEALRQHLFQLRTKLERDPLDSRTLDRVAATVLDLTRKSGPRSNGPRSNGQPAPPVDTAEASPPRTPVNDQPASNGHSSSNGQTPANGHARVNGHARPPTPPKPSVKLPPGSLGRLFRLGWAGRESPDVIAERRRNLIARAGGTPGIRGASGIGNV